MKRDIPQIHSFLSTCIAIIMFTSFFQGSGIAFLVEWLGMTLKSLKAKADFAGDQVKVPWRKREPSQFL